MTIEITELTHLNDPKWISLRKVQWQRILNHELTAELSTKKEREIHKDYFFTGDFYKFSNSLDEVYPGQYLQYYPANTLAQVKEISKIYWNYALKKFTNKQLGNFDKNFLMTFNANINVTLEGAYLPSHLINEIFFWIYGEAYKAERKIDIGLDNWTPSLSIDLKYISRLILGSLYLYLSYYDKDYAQISHAHYPGRIDYLYSALPNVDSSVYSLDLVSKSTDSELNNWQLFIRRVLLYFLGYKSSDEEQHDKKLEKRLKDWLFDKNNGMPPEYFELVEYLKEHKRNALEQ